MKKAPAVLALLLCGCAMVQRREPQFLDGFLHPRADSWSSNPESASYKAYLAGQKYGREHPEEKHAMLLAHGYKMVEAVGEYSHGFEVSTFFPVSGGVWWIESLDAKWPEPLSEPPPFRVASERYRFSGYLSPEGRYGHLGQCARRLLVTRIEKEANPESSVSAKPDTGHLLNKP